MKIKTMSIHQSIRAGTIAPWVSAKNNPNVHEENNGKYFAYVGDEKWIKKKTTIQLAGEFHKQNTKSKK